MRVRTIALAGVLLLAACNSDRAGWARRGSYWKLEETPTIQVRRGTQYVDRATGELVVNWVGARALEGEILSCSLVVFDDKDGDRRVDPGEALASRESLERTKKILFDDVRVRPTPGARLRARLELRTGEETSVVVWDLVAG
jgi:hypothetical protein